MWRSYNRLASGANECRSCVSARAHPRLYKSVPNVPSPLLYKGIFYAIKDGGIATALTAESGDVVKEGRIAPSFGTIFASPVAGDGKIYVVNQVGKVAVLKGAADWELLEINDLAEDCFATPALSGDRIIIRTSGHLWCFRDSPNS